MQAQQPPVLPAQIGSHPRAETAPANQAERGPTQAPRGGTELPGTRPPRAPPLAQLHVVPPLRRRR
eukprot:1114826-Prymnesium_polylepis.1